MYIHYYCNIQWIRFFKKKKLYWGRILGQNNFKSKSSCRVYFKNLNFCIDNCTTRRYRNTTNISHTTHATEKTSHPIKLKECVFSQNICCFHFKFSERYSSITVKCVFLLVKIGIVTVSMVRESSFDWTTCINTWNQL